MTIRIAIFLLGLSSLLLGGCAAKTIRSPGIPSTGNVTFDRDVTFAGGGAHAYVWLSSLDNPKFNSEWVCTFGRGMSLFLIPADETFRKRTTSFSMFLTSPEYTIAGTDDYHIRILNKFYYKGAIVTYDLQYLSSVRNIDQDGDSVEPFGCQKGRSIGLLGWDEGITTQVPPGSYMVYFVSIGYPPFGGPELYPVGRVNVKFGDKPRYRITHVGGFSNHLDYEGFDKDPEYKPNF
jgi:hypothetical protein